MSQLDWRSIPKLGFGLMRLPRQGEATDLEQVKEMVDRFMAAGMTYFDTAYVYGTSEADTKAALVDRYPRQAYTMASKINATFAKDEADCKKQFATSLARTGAGYFDFYLLHALMEKNYKKYDDYNLWDFVRQKKEEGLIRHYGFSFHAGPDLLDRLLTAHPDVEFVQLQINYADWDNPEVTARANYEVARKHGVPVVVMEPVKGGALANPPAPVRSLLQGAQPHASPASWAIRFAASLDGVMTVLSGMSNLAQMDDNLSYMKDFAPLNPQEQEIIGQAQELLRQSAAIPCTACRYCVDGCPMEIPIPAVFAAMNKQFADGPEEAKADYETAVSGVGRAGDCIGCGQCEAACPQHIPIIERLKQGAEWFEQ